MNFQIGNLIMCYTYIYGVDRKMMKYRERNDHSIGCLIFYTENGTKVKMQFLKCYTLGSPIQLNRVAVLAKEPHC